MRTPGSRWRCARRSLAALALAVCAASAAPAADRLVGLRACRAIADTAARLACFDRESAALAPADTPPPLAPEQAFGLSPDVVAAKESAVGARPASVSDIEARVVTLQQNPDGRVAFTLENGQVWLQVVPGEELLVVPGDRVKLARGALSSFWLRAASGRSCKVRRIR